MQTYTYIIKEVSSQVCWRPWRGHQAAIFFELGEKLITRKGGEPRQGSYSICLDMCDWEMLKEANIVSSSHSNYTEMENHLLLFKDKTLLDITVDETHHSANLHFSDNLAVIVKFDKDKAEWSILTRSLECIFRRDGILVQALREN